MKQKTQLIDGGTREVERRIHQVGTSTCGVREPECMMAYYSVSINKTKC